VSCPVASVSLGLLYARLKHPSRHWKDTQRSQVSEHSAGKRSPPRAAILEGIFAPAKIPFGEMLRTDVQKPSGPRPRGRPASHRRTRPMRAALAAPSARTCVAAPSGWLFHRFGNMLHFFAQHLQTRSWLL